MTARHDGRAVLVTVEDQGPGIPEDKLTAIFDRFYTERPAGEKFGTHSGLGLSISKQIVEAHRGRIWAENRRDAQGSGRRRAVPDPPAGRAMNASLLVHATAVAIDGRAVLLRGPSGSGKSDLALRLIDAGARLVADDQSELSRRGDVLMVRAPATIAGLIEVRGLGILRFDALAEAPVALIADLVPADRVERLPPRRTECDPRVAVPVIAMAPFEASAAAKLRLALRAVAALPKDDERPISRSASRIDGELRDEA